jgi:heat shock protein HslJ
MTFIRLIAGRLDFVRGALAVLLLTLWGAAPGWPAGGFPFDQELLLDAAPMPPAKRVPILNVSPDGNATIDLWCRTVSGRVEVSDTTIKIEPAPLPEALPELMADGQCTPERMQADQDMLVLLSQMTGWQRDGDAVTLNGPKTLKFLLSSH